MSSGVNTENLHLPNHCSYLQIIIFFITTVIIILIYTLEAKFSPSKCVQIQGHVWIVKQMGGDMDSFAESDTVFNIKSLCLYAMIFIQVLSFMVLMVCMMIYLNEKNEIES